MSALLIVLVGLFCGLMGFRCGRDCERARCLHEIESAIDDWNYPGEVAESVVAVLINVGAQVVSGDLIDESGKSLAWADKMEAGLDRDKGGDRE